MNALATVTPLVAVLDSPETAGAIVWWRLSGNVSLETLREQWRIAGLPNELLIKPRDASTAMRRAIRELAERRRLVRPLDKRDGWALVEEHADADSLGYKVLLTAKLGMGDIPQFSDGADEALKGRVIGHYDYFRRYLVQDDISPWLSNTCMAAVKAVSLRDTGGVYFVPRETLPVWRQIVRALRAASQHELCEVPAMRSEEAVGAILAAVSREATAEIEATETELDTNVLGARALDTRAKRCEAMRAKIETYEQLLGAKLTELRDRLEALSANVVQASLLAAEGSEA